MNTLSDSAWRPSVELAVLPQSRPTAAAPADGVGAGEPGADDDGFRPFGDNGFTFLDFLDIINPLQHIPVIGTLYRRFTGDEIDPGSRVLGGTLFFGPIGLVASIGDVMIKDATGKDMGQHVMALLDEGEARRPPEVADATGAAVADAGVATDAVANGAESEALDPVTAWAMEEVAYRQAVAARTQSSNRARPEARDRAAAPIPAVAAAYADSRRALIAAGLAEPEPAPRMPARLAADPAGARAAQSIIRQTRRSAAMYAAASYGNGAKPTEPRKRADAADSPVATPPGAMAPLGGWFSEAMLKAHEKYRAGSVNAYAPLPTTLDVTR